MRTKLKDRLLPNYTRGEELFNMISHIVGGGLSILILILCVIKSALNANIMQIVTCAVYGTTMIMLYSMSSIYHGLRNEKVKKVFQVLDHCTIYFLIAGTYTPIALCGLTRVVPTLGWTVFGIEWGLVALAVTLTAIDLKKFSVFSMICYIFMGWGIVIIFGKVLDSIGLPGFLVILAGGIMYTIGAVLYGVGKKKKYMHGAFHIFVILGSLFHFIGIFFYILI